MKRPLDIFKALGWTEDPFAEAVESDVATVPFRGSLVALDAKRAPEDQCRAPTVDP